MKFRTMNVSDIGDCSLLFARAFSSSPWNEAWTHDLASKRLSYFCESKGFVGVVAEEAAINGFALGNIEPFYCGPIFYLREMCVELSLQRKGVGSKILEKLQKELELLHVKRMYLATEKSIPAASFYQNNGFCHSQKLGFYVKSIHS